MQPLRKVLIVDDEDLMRNLLDDFLTSQGYQVECHIAGPEALESLKQVNSLLPSAIIAHLRMEPMSGLELLGEVKKSFPSLPFLLFTGSGNPEEKELAFRLGADHFLAKPFSLTALNSLLASLAR